MSSNSPSLPQHFPALDGLRALAILLVIPHNASVLEPPVSAVYVPFVILANMGWIGVQLFFVLSGFLITGNLLDSQDSPNYYKSFFARRVLRIFPLYYALLIFVFLIAANFFPMTPDFQTSKQAQLPLWTFLVNWTGPFGWGVAGFGHFWSLAVEEQFYLVWPFLLRRRNPKRVVSLCLRLIGLAIVLRSLMFFNHLNSAEIYQFTFCRMDALAMGAIAAALVRIPSAHRALAVMSRRFYFYGAAILLLGFGIGIYSPDSPQCQTIGYSLLAFCFALFVLAAAHTQGNVSGFINRLLSSRPLRAIGRYSYAMYLFHLPLGVYIGQPLLKKLFPTVTPGIALIYLLAITAASIAAAALSYRLIERPFLQLKRYFPPQGAAIER